MSNDTPLTYCPRCRESLDCATCATDKKASHPTEGDLTICFYCATVLRFASGLTVRELTRAELDRLDPELRILLVTVRSELLKAKAEL